MCCINRGKPDGFDCVSEGVAYGMLLAAYLADQETFECLWAFAQHHADDAGLMHWRIGPDGSLWGKGAATDADVDMAQALLIACDQFGGEPCEAVPSLLESILTNETDDVRRSTGPWAGVSAPCGVTA